MAFVPESRSAEREQRLVCVALVEMGIPTLVDANDATFIDAGEPVAITEMRASVSAFGLTLERLAGGTIIAILQGSGSATDQAERGARAALALRASAPDAPMALVMLMDQPEKEVGAKPEEKAAA